MLESWLRTKSDLIHGYGVQYRATRNDDLERWFRDTTREEGRALKASPDGTLTAEIGSSTVMLIGGEVHVLEIHPVEETSRVMATFIDQVEGIGEWANLASAVPKAIINVQYEVDAARHETLMFRFETSHGDLALRETWLREHGLERDGKRWLGRGPWAPALWEEDDGHTFVIMGRERAEGSPRPERCRADNPGDLAPEK
ncbi:MAG: hypothetical protein KC731_09785 [Myxococcales bacterium]|nr:hypothetical protein [Myxococcales bacterium]